MDVPSLRLGHEPCDVRIVFSLGDGVERRELVGFVAVEVNLPEDDQLGALIGGANDCLECTFEVRRPWVVVGSPTSDVSWQIPVASSLRVSSFCVRLIHRGRSALSQSSG